MTTKPPDSASAPRPDSASLALEEFRQLRAAIHGRGLARVAVSLLTFVSWGVLAVALYQSSQLLARLIPLLVLLVGFELIVTLHVGAERIGRYLFVFYEEAGRLPKWEGVIALFGQTSAARATRPNTLLLPEFGAAALLNLLAGPRSLLAWPSRSMGQVELLAVAGLHLAFLGRLIHARQSVGRQRDRDTAAFRQIAERHN